MRFQDTPWMADPFLSALGARELLATDASAYEGAQIVHDLNEPVPEDLHGRFTLVFDGGSLEHIFNVPVAIANYMELVQVGGHLIITTPGNNYFGHGMYQFSPEFFFRVLSPENGFRVQRLVAMEDYVTFRRLLGRMIPHESAGAWYEVTDPAVLGDRVLLNKSRPVLLALQAQRTHRGHVLRNPVYQSDYASAWSASEAPDAIDHLESNRNGSTSDNRLEAFARKHISIERQMTLAFDLLPRALPFLHPLSLRRKPRSRSFANRAAFHPVRRRRRRWIWLG
jgi:hypothetical protein